MKIGVAGGRHYGERAEKWTDEFLGITTETWVPYQPEIDFLNQTLDAIHARKPITCIVQGEADGADKLAKAWAIRNGVDHLDYPADWDKWGGKAGPIRNAEMLDNNPDTKCWIYFKGGAGTANCMKQAKFRKFNILDLRYSNG